MENASKALIIAGAILLAILLISLGILVYQQASSTINDTNIDAEAAQTFNQKITAYCGTNKSATDINALVQAIAASNGAQNGKASVDQHYISITVNATSGVTGGSVTVSATSTSVTYPIFSAGNTYTATYSIGATGYVDTVTIN